MKHFRKKKRLAAFALSSAVWICCGALTDARAEQDSPVEASPTFANCDRAKAQSIESKSAGTLGEEKILAWADTLVTDTQLLLKENREGQTHLAPSYLRTCYANKQIAWNNLLALSPATVKSRLPFRLALAKMAEEQGQFAQASELYLAAAQAEPTQYLARWRAFVNWEQATSQRAQSTPLASLSQRDVEIMIRQMQELTQSLIDAPRAPREYRIEALRRRARFTQYGLKSYVRAQADWRALLRIEAKDPEALRAVAAYHEQRGEKAEAMQTLQKLSAAEPGNLAATRRTLQLMWEAHDDAGLRLAAQKALQRWPQDAELRALLAAAQSRTGFADEALRTTRELTRLPSPPALARETQARILQQNGEKLAQAKQYGQALALFDESLKLWPQNEELRTRTALLLYDYRREQKFLPAAPSRVDMDQGLKVLQPLLAAQVVSDTVLMAGIGMTAHSSNPAQGEVLCARYPDEYGAFASFELVRDCVSIYRAAKQGPRADELLREAMKNPKFTRQRARLQRAIAGAALP